MKPFTHWLLSKSLLRESRLRNEIARAVALPTATASVSVSGILN
jgi:hypothetical protein